MAKQKKRFFHIVSEQLENHCKSNLNGSEYAELIITLCIFSFLPTNTHNSEQVEAEKEQAKTKENPSHFGYGCKRSCICLIPGQVPCSGLVTLPEMMRGKWRMKNWYKD